MATVVIARSTVDVAEPTAVDPAALIGLLGYNTAVMIGLLTELGRIAAWNALRTAAATAHADWPAGSGVSSTSAFPQSPRRAAFTMSNCCSVISKLLDRRKREN